MIKTDFGKWNETLEGKDDLLLDKETTKQKDKVYENIGGKMNKKQIERAIRAEVKALVADKGMEQNDLEELFKKYNEKWMWVTIKKTVRNIRKKSDRKIQQEKLKIVQDTYYGLEPHSIIDALIGEVVTHAVIMGGIWDITFKEIEYMATTYSDKSWSSLQDIIKVVRDSIDGEGYEVNTGPSEEFLRKNKTRIRNYKLGLEGHKVPVVPFLNSYIDKKMEEWELKNKIKVNKFGDIDLDPLKTLNTKLKDIEFSRVTDFTLLGKIDFCIHELDRALKDLVVGDYDKAFVRRAKDIITRIKTYKENIVESIIKCDAEWKENDFKKAILGYEEAIELSLKQLGLELHYDSFEEIKSYLEDLKQMSKAKYRHELEWLRGATYAKAV